MPPGELLIGAIALIGVVLFVEIKKGLMQPLISRVVSTLQPTTEVRDALEDLQETVEWNTQAVERNSDQIDILTEVLYRHAIGEEISDPRDLADLLGREHSPQDVFSADGGNEREEAE